MVCFVSPTHATTQCPVTLVLMQHLFLVIAKWTCGRVCVCVQGASLRCDLSIALCALGSTEALHLAESLARRAVGALESAHTHKVSSLLRTGPTAHQMQSYTLGYLVL